MLQRPIRTHNTWPSSPTAWPRHQQHHNNSYMRGKAGNSSALTPGASASSISGVSPHLRLSLQRLQGKDEGKRPPLKIKTHLNGHNEISQTTDACMTSVFFSFDSFFCGCFILYRVGIRQAGRGGQRPERDSKCMLAAVCRSDWPEDGHHRQVRRAPHSTKLRPVVIRAQLRPYPRPW